MSISVGLRKGLIAVTALGLMGLSLPAVQAQEPLERWVNQSAGLVDKHMTYPHWAFRKGDTGVSYIRVTINQYGEILNSELIGKSGSRRLDRASLRTVKKIQNFPAIPSSHYGNEMTFGVKLRYDISYPGDELKYKGPDTTVTMKEVQIASLATPAVEIVIFDIGK